LSSQIYLVDTNILVRRDNHELYEESLFPIYWENFDKLVDNGNIISKPAVYKEIKGLFPPKDKVKHFLHKWCVNHKNMFIGHDQKYSDETNFIRKEVKGWYEYHSNRGSADLELVIHAKAHNLVLVTLEGWGFESKQKDSKIPNICERLGAYCRTGNYCTESIDPNVAPFQCIDFVELVRRENLQNPSLFD
jgi:hypothetical protein